MTADELAARGVRVKALEWKQDADNNWRSGHYNINHRWPHNDGPFHVTVYRGPEVGLVKIGSFSTLKAAKAAAQADYEARILAALEASQ